MVRKKLLGNLGLLISVTFLIVICINILQNLFFDHFNRELKEEVRNLYYKSEVVRAQKKQMNFKEFETFFKSDNVLSKYTYVFTDEDIDYISGNIKALSLLKDGKVKHGDKIDLGLFIKDKRKRYWSYTIEIPQLDGRLYIIRRIQLVDEYKEIFSLLL